MIGNVPDSITIFGREYTIKDLPALSVAEGVIGLAAYHDAVIYIDLSADPALALTTLWHEAVHVAQNDLHGQVDEREARWISLFVHNLLVHNPEILEKYLELVEQAGPQQTARKPRSRRMPRLR